MSFLHESNTNSNQRNNRCIFLIILWILNDSHWTGKAAIIHLKELSLINGGLFYWSNKKRYVWDFNTKYLSDCDNYFVILKPLEKAAKLYQTHDNQISIDVKKSFRSIFELLSFEVFKMHNERRTNFIAKCSGCILGIEFRGSVVEHVEYHWNHKMACKI